MEIKVTVIHEFGTHALEVFSALLGRTATNSTTPVKVNPPAAAPADTDVKAATKKGKATPAAKADGVPQSVKDELAANQAEDEITLPAIRNKVVAIRDAGKKDKTLELMAEYEIAKLSDLPAEKYTEFMDKLNAIK